MRRWRTTQPPKTTRKTTVKTILESSLTQFSTTPQPIKPQKSWFIKPSLSSNKVFEKNTGNISKLKVLSYSFLLFS